MRRLEVETLGRVPYAEAWAMQRACADRRKRGEAGDRLLLVEHPHVLTFGRNAHMTNLLAPPAKLRELNVEVHEIDRGGDVTYHGPGQVVGYPIVDLREWKRDVVAYVRGIEQSVMAALRKFGIDSFTESGATGVWTSQGKICAIGVHISRWVTTHGFALNWKTDLSYFGLIVPCGLQRPVTSMEAMGAAPPLEAVHEALVEEFAREFGYDGVEWSAAVAAQ
ncbi:MAG: lipoyl(octanoyl) transferase LipB [Bryobacter sp.]|jgi:lipoate-protein ligase B|nr:lipoyl(octanoyl) transferase LipB [Bryobacter sp.]